MKRTIKDRRPGLGTRTYRNTWYIPETEKERQAYKKNQRRRGQPEYSQSSHFTTPPHPYWFNSQLRLAIQFLLCYKARLKGFGNVGNVVNFDLTTPRLTHPYR